MKPIIKVENLSKQYRLGTIGTGTIREDVQRWWHRVRGKEDPYLIIGETNDRSTKGSSDYVWALKDINFEVMPGEVLGIIGKNGAGKSTLLKILSKVTGPTSGRIDFNGRIGSLLEVGTGFHPDLTGRENIFLNGAILGMTKREIRSKLDEIIDFSGCERYIDTPVKRYSSGMTVRLGFAVAAHLDPEILVVDEVLAVGDAEFQKKAIGKMQDVSRNQGRTVLFVSHNMGAVKNLCEKSIIISNGYITSTGETTDIISQYLENNINVKSRCWVSNKINYESAFIKNVYIKRILGKQPNLKLEVSIEIESAIKFNNCLIAFDITDKLDTPIFQTIPEIELEYRKNNVINLILELPPLIPGEYYISTWIGPHNTITYDWVKSVVCFEIEESPQENRTFPFSNDHGFLFMKSYMKHEGAN
ncbi:ABC transporter ATP-binding protein [Spirosoma endbachense]|uniref:ATP-binding cassette domain-containing protein n=1 Tax=Spirosoma endbachense TaxID=2666025 RepID=A0A6P1VT63_9BACT|nr:ABC transporter ATP-binding protein [Spirosoma endbachense]QHV95282.1 ATP-binding cassette domain-containing protein [Spirosoma endbachense]